MVEDGRMKVVWVLFNAQKVSLRIPKNKNTHGFEVHMVRMVFF